MKPEFKIFPDKNMLIQESAASIAGLIKKLLIEKGKCSFVLAGGSTPEGVYETLASGAYRERIDWSKVHLFWGDERCVLPDHPGSNYRMANEALIDHIAIPQENVHRIPAEKEPAIAANEYESSLRKFYGDKADFPTFDIVLLGIGEDGHTASLFPGTSALEENRRWVTEVYVSKLDVYRITMTLPVINNGKNIIFLVAGAPKADIVKHVYNRTDATYPAMQVEPVDGKLVYFLDKAAGVNVDLK